MTSDELLEKMIEACGYKPNQILKSGQTIFERIQSSILGEFDEIDEEIEHESEDYNLEDIVEDNSRSDSGQSL